MERYKRKFPQLFVETYSRNLALVMRCGDASGSSAEWELVHLSVRVRVLAIAIEFYPRLFINPGSQIENE